MIITLAQKFTPKMQWWGSGQQKCKPPPKYKLYNYTPLLVHARENLVSWGTNSHKSNMWIQVIRDTNPHSHKPWWTQVINIYYFHYHSSYLCECKFSYLELSLT
jgi:hypothetical protein